MRYTWEKLGEGRDATHLLTVNDERVAVIWFYGGFVDRQDSWTLKLKGQHDTMGYETLAYAKRAAEDELKLGG